MEMALTDEMRLVEASLAGSREAFGDIVSRYQNLVCAITCGGIGNVEQGRDLAQETFLAAWRELAGLRDRAKLRPWLTGIARNLVRSARRQAGREADRAASLAEHMCQDAPAGPDDEAEMEEKRLLLRRAMEGMPDEYREPLVLFYFEGQSAARVADELELTEEAARQRLSRGRAMLKKELAAFVEETLVRARPTKTFAIAVLAALPALTTPAAAAGIGAAAGKNAVASGLGALAGPLIGVLGAVIGVKASIDNTRSPRERAFMVRNTWRFVGLVAVFLALTFLTMWVLRSNTTAQVAAAIALAVAYTVVLVVMIVKLNRRQKAIQIEEGTYIDPATQPGGPMPRKAIYGSLAGGVFGSTCWMVLVAAIAGDWPTAGAIILASGAIFALGARACLRDPERYYRKALGVIGAVGGLTLVVVNLRWNAWLAAYRKSPLYQSSNDMPLWAVNLIVLALFGFLAIQMLLLGRRQRASERSTDMRNAD